MVSPETSNEQLKESLDEIHGIFEGVIGISGLEPDMQNQAAVNTKYGKALGLSYAVQCLIDYFRTIQLLRGLTLAIAKKQAEHPKEKIKIFYAGCGPYAPFITLVAPLYKPSEVQFTLLDINPKSIEFAKTLIQDLKLEEYVDAVFVGDAITSEIPNPDSYHILFSETLDSLLYREAYVPILCNLLPQFSKDVILIPENVQLIMSFVSI